MYISSKHTVDCWHALDLTEPASDTDIAATDWPKAVVILKDRIETRYIHAAQSLIDAQSNQPIASFGFSILAIDFIVAETVEGFREGLTEHNGQSGNLIKKFLARISSIQNINLDENEKHELLNTPYKKGRCAIHHSGSTKGITVDRCGEAVSKSGEEVHINRDKFHNETVEQFHNYCNEVLQPENAQLRHNLKTKMEFICSH